MANIPIWPGSSSFFPGDTPFGFYDNDFQFQPQFGDKTVGEYEQITGYLTKKVKTPNPYPTLLFFDPWGYKGIDTLALGKFMQNWGNEIFLFVNIKRIHAAIENDKFDALMQSLFPTSFKELQKQRRYKATVYERLSLIMDNLANEFEKAVNGKLYHSAFKFQEEDSRTTSHFIIHFTKHSKGYELVKQIYYDFDNIGAVLDKDGSYTFDAKETHPNIIEEQKGELDKYYFVIYSSYDNVFLGLDEEEKILRNGEERKNKKIQIGSLEEVATNGNWGE